MDLEVTRADIETAASRISPHTRLTPLVKLGDVFEKGWRLSLKLDHLQPTGSFKARGAFSVLTARTPTTGVAAASGGNFGIATAYACSKLGYQATIFVPETSPPEKIDRMGEHGAEVNVIPGYYHQALAACEAFVADTGAFMAQPTTSPRWSQVWAQPRGRSSVRPTMSTRWWSRSVEVGGVAASSLAAASIGEHTWYARRWIDRSVLVSDDQVVDAQKWLWANIRLAVEPAAATTVASLMSGS